MNVLLTPDSIRPCGDHAVLVDLGTQDRRRALDAALQASPPTGLVDLVPALRTLLLTFATEAHRADAVARLRSIDVDALPVTAPDAGQPIDITVHYNGPDLADVAAHLGIVPAEVVRRHTAQLWTVDFAGFMPGFGYLTGDAGGLDVRRLATPRTRVPAGSVALAGSFTGVYPSPSPGGWRIIGTTDAVLFDADRTPPALLSAGRRVRFVEDPR